MPGSSDKGQGLGCSYKSHPGGLGACFESEVTWVLSCGQLGPGYNFYSWSSAWTPNMVWPASSTSSCGQAHSPPLQAWALPCIMALLGLEVPNTQRFTLLMSADPHSGEFCLSPTGLKVLNLKGVVAHTFNLDAQEAEAG